jgi:hypothetical protein
MKLANKIVINPPPFTNNKDEIEYPSALEFTELEVTYHDNPTQKRVTATISQIPGEIFLLDSDMYDQAGDYTQEFIESKLVVVLGDDPASYLRSRFPKTLEENPNGPGSILTNMIKSIGIKSSSSCSCRRHALEMNDNGPEWCEQNLDTIVSWLKDESKKRGLPFIEAVGKMMVNRAIAKSKKLLANG